MAPSLSERSNRSTPCWACCLEGEKGSKGQDKEGSQEEKACIEEEEEEKTNKVFLATLG